MSFLLTAIQIAPGKLAMAIDGMEADACVQITLNSLRIQTKWIKVLTFTFFDARSCYIAQSDLELLASSDSSVSASRVVATTSMGHHAVPQTSIFFF